VVVVAATVVPLLPSRVTLTPERPGSACILDAVPVQVIPHEVANRCRLIETRVDRVIHCS